MALPPTAFCGVSRTRQRVCGGGGGGGAGTTATTHPGVKGWADNRGVISCTDLNIGTVSVWVLEKD